MFDQLVQVVFCNKKSDVLKSGAALPPENWNLPMMTIYEQWAGPCWDVVLGDETSLRWWLLWYGIIKISIHQSVSEYCSFAAFFQPSSCFSQGLPVVHHLNLLTQDSSHQQDDITFFWAQESLFLNRPLPLTSWLRVYIDGTCTI